MPDNQTIVYELRNHARQIFSAAIGAVEAGAAVKRQCLITGSTLTLGPHAIDLSRYKHIYVVGAGKATASMALAMEAVLEDRIDEGIISVKYRHTKPLKIITTIEAAHPVPDKNGCDAAARILSLAQKAGKDDLVICLLSGGGSALLPLPAPGLSLEQKQETISILLACGADINEINTVRKHLSAIKGGQLARAAAPATIISLILSDVVGDRLDVIASGPGVADPGTFLDCMKLVDRYKLSKTLPAEVIRHLNQGVSGIIPETPKPGEIDKSRSLHHIIGSNFDALQAAAGCAAGLGYNSLILSSMIEGDTTQAARFHAAVAKEIVRTGHPVSIPACVLSGGETTVVVEGKGKGGRNQEFCLAAALEISDCENTIVLSGGTDGTDGPTDAAGAIADNSTAKRARSMGMDPCCFLKENDSWNFFEKTGDLLVTGPTHTNVMDVRILLIA